MKIDTPFCFFFLFLVLGSLSCVSALAQDGTRRSLKSSLGTFLNSIAWFLISDFITESFTFSSSEEMENDDLDLGI